MNKKLLAILLFSFIFLNVGISSVLAICGGYWIRDANLPSCGTLNCEGSTCPATQSCYICTCNVGDPGCSDEGRQRCMNDPTCNVNNCGNNLINGGEDCDGWNSDGKTCVDVGFLGGILSCNPDCTFNTTYCSGTAPPPVCGDSTCSTSQGENCLNCDSDCHCSNPYICRPDLTSEPRGCYNPSSPPPPPPSSCECQVNACSNICTNTGEFCHNNGDCYIAPNTPQCECGDNGSGLDVCSNYCTNPGMVCTFGQCIAPVPNPNPNPNPGPGSSGGIIEIDNPLNATSVEAVIDSVVNFIFWFGMALAPLMIIIAGFFFLTAGGESDKITKAKNIITWTFVGLLIILMGKGLISALRAVLGG